jgi:hypothetical protein
MVVSGTVQTNWDKAVVCAPRTDPVMWRFKVQRFNLVKPSDRRLRVVSRHKPDVLEQTFTRLSHEWRTETGHLSSIERKAMHPAYQAIIGMGRSGVPYVLRELKNRGGHWFWALHFMTGIDLSKPNQTKEELAKEWIEWGRGQGYDGL